MGLTSGNTQWVLFLATSQDMPEDRHIADIAFGLYVLNKRGINFKDIFVVIDGEDDEYIQQILATNKCMIHKSPELPLLLNLGYENLVLFVTGHGNISGIDSKFPIKPYGFLSYVKDSTSIKTAVLYLGQCYAGIFHYLNVVKNETNNKTIVIIGATNLFNSVSNSLQLPRIDGNLHPTEYNLFLSRLFQWIEHPIDIDGDGRFTIIDSYKYASAKANDTYKELKVSHANQYRLMKKMYEIEEKLKLEKDVLKQFKLSLYLESRQVRHNEILSIQFNHQESWILNAIPALDIEI
jgi:hypothetical protein